MKKKYDAVWDFSEELALVEKDRKYGYIDKSEKEVIACQYDYAGSFIKGLALVKKGRKYGVINKSGDWICDLIIKK